MSTVVALRPGLRWVAWNGHMGEALRVFRSLGIRIPIRLSRTDRSVVFRDREQIKHRGHVERAVGGDGSCTNGCAQIKL